MSRKRKAPVASSVVRVNRTADEDSDDVEEEEDEGYGGRSLSSRVSLPSKSERRSVVVHGVTLDRYLYVIRFCQARMRLKFTII